MNNQLAGFKQASDRELEILKPRLQQIILAQKQQKLSKIRIKGRDFCIYPQVFNPKKGKASLMMLKYLSLVNNLSVLDVGCGIGTYAIFAGYHGASKVLGVDINPHAVSCAKENVKMHDMGNIIEIKKSDVFNVIPKEQKFDVILSNPPFFREGDRSRKEDYIDRCFLDSHGKFIHEFLKKAKEFLSPNGKILLLYGKSGFVNEVLELIEIYGYYCRILETKNRPPDKYYVLELSHQL